jgi:hypothetical protein
MRRIAPPLEIAIFIGGGERLFMRDSSGNDVLILGGESFHERLCMSHPELLKQTFANVRVQGVSPCRGAGCPRNSSFSLSRRLRRRVKRGKKGFAGHPAPW